jgi:hypothetical protein
MTSRRATAMLAGLTLLVLALSLRASLRDALEASDCTPAPS